MNKAHIESFFKEFRRIMLSLKSLAFKAVSTKSRMIGLAASILVLMLIVLLATYSRKKPIEKPAEEVADTQIETIEPTINPALLETQPVGIPATMGTITTDRLNIWEDAGVVVDEDAYYGIGDRVEIHETKDINGTRWGLTGLGWVRMDCIRMDDVPNGSDDLRNSGGIEIVSNGSYTVLGYGVVDLQTLNVRAGPGTNYTKITEVSQGIRYADYEESGEWVRIGEGWVSTLYFYVEGTTAETATTGTITTNDLNVRSGPDTAFKRINTYMEEDSVQILAVVNGWGYTEKGWISMMYVKLPEPVYTTGNATVTVGLNIRKEPDPDSEKVDAYKEGEGITIIEVKDGWGKTDKGWINLDYVKYD